MLLFGSNTVLIGAVVGGISVVIKTNVMKDYHKDDDS